MQSKCHFRRLGPTVVFVIIIIIIATIFVIYFIIAVIIILNMVVVIMRKRQRIRAGEERQWLSYKETQRDERDTERLNLTDVCEWLNFG